MQARSLSKYRFYCITESTYVYIWSELIPLVCSTNNSHTIDTNSITIIDCIKQNDVNIIDETPPTGNSSTQGRFRCNGLECQVPASNYVIKDFGWVYPICALSIKFNGLNENVGDYIDLYVIPNIKLGNTRDVVEIGDTIIPLTSACFNACTVGAQLFIMDNTHTWFLGAIISKDTNTESITITNPSDKNYNKNSYITFMTSVGTITQNITSSDNLITVSNSVVNNMVNGQFITVTDGITMDNLGEIFEIDKINSTILVQSPSSINYNSGSYLFPSVHVIKNYKINNATNYIIGESSIGGSYVRPFYIVRLVYRNSTPLVSKNFNWYVEYKY